MRSCLFPSAGQINQACPFSRPEKTFPASEWRLTFNTCDVTDELPSKAFMRWDHES
jgi:hypothetical protein